MDWCWYWRCSYIPGWLILYLARVGGRVLVFYTGDVSIYWMIDPSSLGIHELVLVLEMFLPTGLVDPVSCEVRRTWTSVGIGDVPTYCTR